MPVLDSYRERVAQDIGAALTTNELIQLVVQDATGLDPYNILTTDRLPRARQILEILDGLEREGMERWFLTSVLLRAIDNDALRQRIVLACPETLVALPTLDEQTGRILINLQKLLTRPLPEAYRYRLWERRVQITEIVQRTAALLAYKSLHELLHGLQLKMAFGQALPGTERDDLASCQQQVENVCRQAREMAKLLRADSVQELIDAGPAQALLKAGLAREKAELDWIEEFETLGRELQSEIAAGHLEGAAAMIEAKDVRIRLILVGLNTKVLEAARQLSLSDLLAALPDDIQDAPAFIDLSHSIRDLKPTVLARALKHKMWQDAEKEFLLIGDYFAGVGNFTDDFRDRWYVLKTRIRWLADLDPNDDWAKRARKYSDDVADKLAVEKGIVLDAMFKGYRDLIRFCFFAIDAALKADCTTLQRIDESLKMILREIGHV